MSDNEFRDFLQSKGYKYTKQRQIVMEIFSEHSDEHMTTEEVFRYASEKMPEIGIATVYRAVGLLESIGYLTAITFEDGTTRYERRHKEEKHIHHHLICNNCNKIMEVNLDLLDELEDEIEKTVHFHITDHNLKFYGLCEECRKAMEGESDEE
ncbi:MAG: Fur family transcriptional regulator [Peptoniphilus sp.]|nr:Fur family transcriptional regulator [Peptoniphilus sp.]MDD7363831.1 Fur family transcriptional regulator [Bacillota bacterium]MDY6044330.1 Fur family transcriptional regulator [Peptoniphilus sp.]